MFWATSPTQPIWWVVMVDGSSKIQDIRRATDWVNCSRSVVLKLGSPDVLGLKCPEILASIASGEGFWELQSKNSWGPQFENHWSRSYSQYSNVCFKGLSLSYGWPMMNQEPRQKPCMHPRGNLVCRLDFTCPCNRKGLLIHNTLILRCYLLPSP